MPVEVRGFRVSSHIAVTHGRSQLGVKPAKIHVRSNLGERPRRQRDELCAPAFVHPHVIQFDSLQRLSAQSLPCSIPWRFQERIEVLEAQTFNDVHRQRKSLLHVIGGIVRNPIHLAPPQALTPPRQQGRRVH